jgi:hypothetical protein
MLPTALAGVALAVVVATVPVTRAGVASSVMVVEALLPVVAAATSTPKPATRLRLLEANHFNLLY